MKRLAFLLLAMLVAFSLVLAGCGGAKQEAASPAKEESLSDLFAKGKKVPGMSYDYVMTAKDMQMTGKMWVAGKKMKSEMTMQNQRMISIIDADAKVAYSIQPDQNMAFKVSLDKAKMADTPDKYTEVDTTKVKVLETTTYEGVKCKVVLFQEADGKAQTKMWVREDYGIPMKVEVTDPGGAKMVMEYKNLKVGPIPPETFNLPAGVKVTDLSDMMKNMPKQ